MASPVPPTIATMAARAITTVLALLFLLVADALAGSINTLSIGRQSTHVAHGKGDDLPQNIDPNLKAFLSESKARYFEDVKAKEGSGGLDMGLRNADEKRSVITVKKDGTGDFKTVSAAVKSIRAGNTRTVIIKIGPGVYKEKVRVDKSRPFVTFYGDPKDPPTITFNSRAADVGTWESATVAVSSRYFMAVNMIFENTAPNPPMGAKGGQAVAFRISADKAAFYKCKFLGFQDTLCDDKGKHYYKDCYISGTEDFIFGNARSLFDHCDIVSVSKEGMTAITAQGREDIADKSGFSFVHCKISGTGHAYLSRPWRSKARVVFAYTDMGSVVDPKGWDRNGAGHLAVDSCDVFYAQYQCSGPGASSDTRAKYSLHLTPEQAKPFLSPTFVQGQRWLRPPPSL